MNPSHEIGGATLYTGDSLQVLRALPSESVQCVITSPPYYGLRDYGVDGQIGLEDTPDEFIARLVGVFAEVHRVLRPDGLLWVNMGDSYNSGTNRPSKPSKAADVCGWTSRSGDSVGARRVSCGSLKVKDMLGMPWMLAFALRSWGWYLRQEIIWHKPNPMPESVRDRCTKAHEHVFLLSKSSRYCWDAKAIKEPVSGGAHARRPSPRAACFDRSGNAVADHVIPGQAAAQHRKRTYKMPDGWDTGSGGHGSFHRNGREKGERKLAEPGSGIKLNSSFDEAVADLVDERNKRSVWTIPTEPFKAAHFATFPRALVEPMILVSTKPGDIVLDPFSGSATTGCVALQHGRRYIGAELSPAYQEIAAERLRAELLPKSARPRIGTTPAPGLFESTGGAA